MHLTPNLVAAFAVLALACAAALIGALALSRYARMQRSARTLEGALTQRVAAGAPVSTDSGPARGETPPTGLFAAIGRASIAWLDTSFGRIAVADEDRRLLDRCGYLDARARGAFMLARIAGAALAPVALMLLARGTPHGARFMLLLFVALSGGFMAPKWFVQSRANARQRAVGNELPMFVDLLRLLQGVGLSLDQSLQVMIHDFKTVLPILSKELAAAQAQFATGRTREQSLKRLSSSYENEDLAAVVRLVIQVEKYGGAVQEPLRQFGDRLREARRAALRERIGKVTVKMTGVMVLTLLPALLIVTAGPGFLAVLHSLSGLHR
ncbi:MULTISPECIES: type II secretion system F family protein [unclassified Caballeronia]|uniref:type II secretion system F family protein n=1 Tax=unclassified Caballeronia TaxID=2646786 RepID=UPI001FD35D73|nr:MULTISPECIES: type II secretion system F family protein [unclassified Caballeronia]